MRVTSLFHIALFEGPVLALICAAGLLLLAIGCFMVSSDMVSAIVPFGNHE